MKTFLLKMLLLLHFCLSVKCILCWNCNGRNNDECKRRGELLNCPGVSDVCSTEVRRNLAQRRIIKQCKQIYACLSDQSQNWNIRDAGQCNKGLTSVCRCCCFQNFCNKEELCEAETANSCRRLPTPTNLQTSCTDSNNVDSICNFQCTDDGLMLLPTYSQQSTCLPNGKWSRPIPCCTLPCPPNVLMDMVVLTHRKTEEITHRHVKDVAALTFKYMNFGPNGVHYSRLHYGERIHEPYLHFEDTINVTTAEALDYIMEEFNFNETESGIVNTGAALQYVHSHVFGSHGDRENVQNVLLLSTDENSDDDVAEPSRLLREAGVLIFPYFIISDPNENVDHKQLQDISGIANHRAVSTRQQVKQNADSYFAKTYKSFCSHACPYYV